MEDKKYELSLDIHSRGMSEMEVKSVMVDVIQEIKNKCNKLVIDVPWKDKDQEISFGEVEIKSKSKVFAVYENNKPCILGMVLFECEKHVVSRKGSWTNNTFHTLKEAAEYMLKWCGNYSTFSGLNVEDIKPDTKYLFAGFTMEIKTEEA